MNTDPDMTMSKATPAILALRAKFGAPKAPAFLERAAPWLGSGHPRPHGHAGMAVAHRTLRLGGRGLRRPLPGTWKLGQRDRLVRLHHRQLLLGSSKSSARGWSFMSGARNWALGARQQILTQPFLTQPYKLINKTEHVYWTPDIPT